MVSPLGKISRVMTVVLASIRFPLVSSWGDSVCRDYHPLTWLGIVLFSWLSASRWPLVLRLMSCSPLEGKEITRFTDLPFLLGVL